MITLHHLEYSQSFRVLWLLEELGIEYELKKYDRDPKTLMAPEHYKAVSPLGTAPVITDGEIRLAETSAIMDYILDKHPDSNLRPETGAKERLDYLFWSHASQGSVMPLMLMNSVFKILSMRVPFFLKIIISPVLKAASKGIIQPRMEKLLEQAEITLTQNKFFAGGNLSCADILLSYPLESANARGFVSDEHPKVKAWLVSIKQRPAFVRAKQLDDRESMLLPL